MSASSSSSSLSKAKLNCCAYCNKKYVRKTDCDKHQLLCNILSKTRRELQINADECNSTISHSQLCTIVQELALKCAKMEEKMNTMQKWTDKQKKKINIIQWLNDNNIPACTFAALKPAFSSHIGQKHIDHLIDTNLLDTIQYIFETSDAVASRAPIYCFEQKHHVFYIYNVMQDASGDGNGQWSLMSRDDLIHLLNTVHSKLLRELVAWKKIHEQTMAANDKMSMLFNKTMIKLVEVDFTSDHSLSRIKSSLFNHLKRDLKNIIEYEFE
jgi:hypothetical protein